MTIKHIKHLIVAAMACCTLTASLTACSDSYMAEVNTDDTKASSIDPAPS